MEDIKAHPFYDDIDWVEEMMEHLTRLHLAVLKRLAAVANGRLTADSSHWWEDMCYNKGPLLSPKMFAELMVPRYRRVTDYKSEVFGTQYHSVDCDGNIHELVGLWLEGGINVMFPIEVAHTDAFRIRDEFGERVAMQGGFNKLALIAGPDAIDAEFKRIDPLIKEGGFQIDFERVLFLRITFSGAARVHVDHPAAARLSE